MINLFILYVQRTGKSIPWASFFHLFSDRKINGSYWKRNMISEIMINLFILYTVRATASVSEKREQAAGRHLPPVSSSTGKSRRMQFIVPGLPFSGGVYRLRPVPLT